MSDLFSQHEKEQTPTRVIGWFSCGVTSAVACKLAMADYPNVQLVRIVLGGEHPDNERFHTECEKWFGKPILSLYPPRYRDHFEVAEKRRFINGPQGALCTAELKRRTREVYQRAGDLHVFRFDSAEEDRANDYRDKFGLWMSTPLLEASLSKADCKAIVERAGIKLPVMYDLGYAHNNCIGCWKGGMGYWNKIRVDFPDVFARAAEVCKSIGRSPIKDKDGKPIMLHDLDPNRGRFEEDQPPSCGPMCELAIVKMG